MQLFYAPSIILQNFELDAIESRHCIQALRHKEGDSIYVTDGIGHLYKAIITIAHPKKCTFQIQESLVNPSQPTYDLHIAIAPTKNMNRFEWFLEKATEIGITTITPILTARSERKKVRLDRLEKVLVTALKQSVKTILPTLNEPIKLATFLKKETLLQQYDCKGIAYVATDTTPLKELYQPKQKALLLIGPEGDFTKEEIELAKMKGFTGISLGKSRLRTETAGIVACHTVSLLA